MPAAVIATLWGMSAVGWTAAATVGLFALALAAALVAGWQLKEARDLRLQQAQPYVGG